MLYSEALRAIFWGILTERIKSQGAYTFSNEQGMKV
jgi:hypothetical protein